MRLAVRRLGMVDYAATVTAMREFTAARDPSTPDEVWLVQHPPIFTLGLGGKMEHVLNPGSIPVVRTDRGGQVTYHGPGQLIAYVLIDLSRQGWSVRQLVWALEESVVRVLHAHRVQGQRRAGAPGVYVDDCKIAALGLRIRHGCSYHGLALNVAMELSPFTAINPCGFPALRVTQTQDLGITANIEELGTEMMQELQTLIEWTDDRSSTAVGIR